MQFTFNLDIQAIIDKTMAPENIQPVLEKAVSKAFSAAVDDATGYRSEFQETLKKQLNEAMPHGLHITDVAKFQFLLNQAVASLVHGANQAAIETAVAKAVGKVAPEVPTLIKLSELVEAARDGFHKENHEEFYARFEPSSYGGGGHIYFDSDSSLRSNYEAEVAIAINQQGEAYTLKMNHTEVTPAKLPQAINRFDGLLLSLYVGRTTIEVDIDERDVEYAAQAKED